jgi:quercetin dioxygenase-like cupin family protein
VDFIIAAAAWPRHAEGARRLMLCTNPAIPAYTRVAERVLFFAPFPRNESAMKHIKWDDVPAERLNDKFVRKLAWDGQIMIGMTLVEKGYVVPLHAHDNQQVTYVESGIWRFRLEDRVVDVGPREMIFIPANVPHTAEAIETLVAYDVFTPPREDWISGKDNYLRK